MARNTKMSLLLVAMIVANLSLWVSSSLARRGSAFEQLDLLVDVRYELVNGYVREPDQEEMVKSAIQGMIASLNDPYTTYLSPDDLKQFDKQVRGSFSGIGAEVMIDPDLNRLKIVSPLEESPAWKAGVMAGDIVLEIDKVTTEGMKITEAVDRLTGPEGTQVTILVRHESGEEQTITITRARINIQTVKGIRRGDDQHWRFMLDEEQKIGYIRLTQFSDSTAEELKAALETLGKEGMKGLIMDLRFNPGGLLESAVQVSDMFLAGGKRIVSVKGRPEVAPEQAETSTDEATLFSGPMVVLGNEASASASEIVSGALRDNDRAIFLGTRTFGKGSVQQVRMLQHSQGALKMTNAYYYLPKGEKIHRVPGANRWGVDPQPGFFVPMTPEQIKVMLEKRREADVVRAGGGEKNGKLTVESIGSEMGDIQLAAALGAIQGKLKDGEFPKVGKDISDDVERMLRRENLSRQRDLLQERLTKVKDEIDRIDRGEPLTPPKKAATDEDDDGQ